uniref:Uncharacterized protein n=1 Tax=Hyaloperonospora arabidopsidis (strain Emoy2) TaxID=559515 RepID=M4B1Y8_HYAAE
MSYEKPPCDINSIALIGGARLIMGGMSQDLGLHRRLVDKTLLLAVVTLGSTTFTKIKAPFHGVIVESGAKSSRAIFPPEAAVSMQRVPIGVKLIASTAAVYSEQ